MVFYCFVVEPTYILQSIPFHFLARHSVGPPFKFVIMLWVHVVRVAGSNKQLAELYFQNVFSNILYVFGLVF